ncbi:PHD and RING finger domain-containing protein 1 isoform X2 [Polypterus senegalus]|uniref:PHD and RING finger domain-containing protein 1 isoform X2 n=1 Tax=Polypterus senegalus TaxID=55291 RepID=UPI001962CACB|nr:PHD and RING finger domain-containing protein 1 isoform X2 [Polypterus senegalus]
MDDDDSHDELINKNAGFGRGKRCNSALLSDDEISGDEHEQGETDSEDDDGDEDDEEDDSEDLNEEEEEECSDSSEDCEKVETEKCFDRDFETLTNELTIEHSDNEEENCPICLNTFQEQVLGTPESCAHYFCLDCILEWSKNANSCPVDRIVFKNICIRSCFKGKILKKVPVQNREPAEDQFEEDQTICEVCGRSDREDRLLLCDGCDDGYHMECLNPPLDAVPVEEWFCPECAINNPPQDLSADEISEGEVAALIDDTIPTTSRLRSSARRTRVIARTRQSERVRASVNRSRITQARTLQSVPRHLMESNLLDETINAVVAGLNTAVYVRPLAPRATTKKRKTRRRRTRKKKPCSKSAAGVQKGGQSSGRRKRRTKKRSSKKRPVVPHAISAKSRIAKTLGIGKPVHGASVPSVYRPVESSLSSMRADIGAAPLSVYGDPFDLDPFDERNREQPASPLCPIDAKRKSLSQSAIRSHQPVARPVSIGISRTGLSIPEPVEIVEAAPVPDLLGSILTGQSLLMMDSADIIINRDGSLKAKKAVTMPISSRTISCDLRSDEVTSGIYIEDSSVSGISACNYGDTMTSSDVNVSTMPSSSRSLYSTLKSSLNLKDTFNPLPSASRSIVDRPPISSRPRPGSQSSFRPLTYAEKMENHKQNVGTKEAVACGMSSTEKINGFSNSHYSMDLKRTPAKPAWDFDSTKLPKIPKIKREENDTSPQNSHPTNGIPDSCINRLTGRDDHSTTTNTGLSTSQLLRNYPGNSSSNSSGMPSRSVPFGTHGGIGGSTVSFRINASGSSWQSRRFGIPNAFNNPLKKAMDSKENFNKNKQKLLSLQAKKKDKEKQKQSEIYDPFNPTGSDSSSSETETSPGVLQSQMSSTNKVKSESCEQELETCILEPAVHSTFTSADHSHLVTVDDTKENTDSRKCLVTEQQDCVLEVDVKNSSIDHSDNSTSITASRNHSLIEGGHISDSSENSDIIDEDFVIQIANKVLKKDIHSRTSPILNTHNEIWSKNDTTKAVTEEHTPELTCTAVSDAHSTQSKNIKHEDRECSKERSESSSSEVIKKKAAKKKKQSRSRSRERRRSRSHSASSSSSSSVVSDRRRKKKRYSRSRSKERRRSRSSSADRSRRKKHKRERSFDRYSSRGSAQRPKDRKRRRSRSRSHSRERRKGRSRSRSVPRYKEHWSKSKAGKRKHRSRSRERRSRSRDRRSRSREKRSPSMEKNLQTRQKRTTSREKWSSSGEKRNCINRDQLQFVVINNEDISEEMTEKSAFSYKYLPEDKAKTVSRVVKNEQRIPSLVSQLYHDTEETNDSDSPVEGSVNECVELKCNIKVEATVKEVSENVSGVRKDVCRITKICPLDTEVEKTVSAPKIDSFLMDISHSSKVDRPESHGEENDRLEFPWDMRERSRSPREEQEKTRLFREKKDRRSFSKEEDKRSGFLKKQKDRPIFPREEEERPVSLRQDTHRAEAFREETEIPESSLRELTCKPEPPLRVVTFRPEPLLRVVTYRPEPPHGEVSFRPELPLREVTYSYRPEPPVREVTYSYRTESLKEETFRPEIYKEKIHRTEPVREEFCRPEPAVDFEMPRHERAVEPKTSRHEPDVEPKTPRHEPAVEPETPRHEPAVEPETPRHEPAVEPETPRHEPSVEPETPRHEPAVELETRRHKPIVVLDTHGLKTLGGPETHRPESFREPETCLHEPILGLETHRHESVSVLETHRHRLEPFRDLAALTPEAVRDLAALTPEAVRDLAALTPEAVRDLAALTPEAVRDLAALTPEAVRDLAALTPEAVRELAAHSPEPVRELVAHTCAIKTIEKDLAEPVKEGKSGPEPINSEINKPGILGEEKDESFTDVVDDMLDDFDFIKSEEKKDPKVTVRLEEIKLPVKKEDSVIKQEAEKCAASTSNKSKPAVKRVTWNLQEDDETSGKSGRIPLYKMQRINKDGMWKTGDSSQILNQDFSKNIPMASTINTDSPVYNPVSQPTVQFIIQGSLPHAVSVTGQPFSAESEGIFQKPIIKKEAQITEASRAPDKTKSEEYLKKLHMQERAVEEVKLAIKPFYQKREITKEEYKEILRKAVKKVCHSKSGEINPVKVANLIKAYVDKYRQAKKHKKDSTE